ncbi:sulfate adenylyltransferase subunit CysD [Sphingosinicella soli]|uniref:Sulfate adenylyltransferase subunit 2 n=1 Tax=Sphingosinicella soli TaxID=333708 RepID=A0A7W7B0G8_9SPHN|nr:sulfate adenylyltransferase subunit CysD [Sphingosinicella soli]MBB4630705.1 sulfate adenylyltransferase subunit 2 [Sphingosinicella soli]
MTLVDAHSRNELHFSHIRRLEAESIAIIREVAACFQRPVLLYSIGKDSSVLLHLAQKAFAPAPLPFPVLHVDTGWKFREMIAHRDSTVALLGFELLIHTNGEAAGAGITPFTASSAVYNHAMKTEGLKQAMARWGFDAAIGGARRDEEKSRAKERIFSHRNTAHRWEPKTQRPEFWHAWNTHLAPGESMRVFPLSNWTERDVWTYIWIEGIPLVPLYFAKLRPVIRRQDTWIMVDDDRIPFEPGERPELRSVRFRSIGCYPYTGAIESTAATLADVLLEMRSTRMSERQGRLIDHDQPGSMERKKQEGYF